MIFVTFLLIGKILIGQDADRQRVAFYVAKGGEGLGYTINGDFMLKNPICGTWSFRIGAGSLGYVIKDASDQNIDLQLITIPVAANYLVGKNNSFFEAGVGITPIITDFEGMVTNDFFEMAGFNMAFFGNFGYRYQSLGLGGIARLNWTPVFNKEGLSLGRFGISAGISIN
jgi:hypothetical protein